MRVLVTGGAGFIGSHIVGALVARGTEVAVLDDLSTGRRENVPDGVTLYQVDVRDRAAVAGVMREIEPAAVSHQAAQASVKVSMDEPMRDVAVNVVGGLNVLEEALAVGVERFVFASTGGAIYGEVPDGDAAAESWPERPLSPYAISKAAFERYLAVYGATRGLCNVVLRYANVYGPRQDPHGEAGVVAIFSQRLLGEQAVKLFARETLGDGGCVRDYVHVGDVVAANLLALDGALEGTLNVGTGRGRTTRDVLSAIATAAGVEPDIDEAPPRAGDLQASVLDASRLRACGWSPSVDFVDGLASTVQSFRE